jgi:hypothetical protein
MASPDVVIQIDPADEYADVFVLYCVFTRAEPFLSNLKFEI